MQKLFQDMQFYTDIHCHILPGVDDGAGDMEESMQMLRIAYANHIRRMIVTPHHKPMHRHAGQEKIQELIAELSERMKQEQMEISLYPGSELYYSTELVDKLESRRACTMAESAYVLVEFAPMDDWEYIRNGINTLIMAGYIPILAHAERYRSVCTNVPGVEELIGMGAYIQVNASGIMGKQGHTAKQFTRTLLKRRLVHFVATDAHDCVNRSPDLEKCAQWMEKRYGSAYVYELLWENPSWVIEGEYI